MPALSPGARRRLGGEKGRGRKSYHLVCPVGLENLKEGKRFGSFFLILTTRKTKGKFRGGKGGRGGGGNSSRTHGAWKKKKGEKPPRR